MRQGLHLRLCHLLRLWVAPTVAHSGGQPPCSCRSPRGFSVVGPLTSPWRPLPMPWLELREREGGMGGADAAGDRGARSRLRVGRGRRARAIVSAATPGGRNTSIGPRNPRLVPMLSTCGRVRRESPTRWRYRRETAR